MAKKSKITLGKLLEDKEHDLSNFGRMVEIKVTDNPPVKKSILQKLIEWHEKKEKDNGSTF